METDKLIGYLLKKGFGKTDLCRVFRCSLGKLNSVLLGDVEAPDYLKGNVYRIFRDFVTKEKIEELSGSSPVR